MVELDSQGISRAPRYSGIWPIPYALISLTGLSPSLGDLSRSFNYQSIFIRNDWAISQSDQIPQPQMCNAHGLSHTPGLGFSPFARRYSGNRYCFLFLRILRCLTSPGCPLCPIFSGTDSVTLLTDGFPIRKSPDQCLVATSRSFSQLPTSFIVCWHQGILHTPLLT